MRGGLQRLCRWLALAGLTLAAACATQPPARAPGPPPLPRMEDATPAPPGLKGADGAPDPATPDPRVQALLLTRDGNRLPVQCWLPGGRRDGGAAEKAAPRAVILALHGFNDYANAFDAPGRWWARHGIATYAYDQRGFGRNADAGDWAGTATMVHDAEDAAAALHRRWPHTPLFLLGESMGGAVLLAGFAGHPLPPGVRGLILTAPAVWARSTMPFYQRWALAVANHLFPWLAMSPPRGLVHIQASDNIPMMIALGRDPLAIKATRMDTLAGLTDLMDKALASSAHLRGPALMLYGEHDQLIPTEPRALAMAMAQNANDGDQGNAWLPVDARPDNVRLGYYPLGWHMLLRDLHARIVWRDVLAWITDPQAPLPSGADRGAGLAGLLAHGHRLLADGD